MAEDEANYLFAEAPVAGQVHSAQRATPDEIVAIANKIWGEVRKSNIAKDDNQGNDALLERLQTQYKDFSTSFPIVLRWAVQMRQFNHKALRTYLRKHATAKLESREDFLRLQAEYLVLLYRELHAHPDESYVKRYREAIVQQLLEEDKAFVRIQKDVEDAMQRQAADFDRERRARLYEYLVAQKVAAEKVEGVDAPVADDKAH